MFPENITSMNFFLFSAGNFGSFSSFDDSAESSNCELLTQILWKTGKELKNASKRTRVLTNIQTSSEKRAIVDLLLKKVQREEQKQKLQESLLALLLKSSFSNYLLKRDSIAEATQTEGSIKINKNKTAINGVVYINNEKEESDEDVIFL